MSVTIKQIAAMAGVSRGTVDRVLHNRPGVSPEVAGHVRKIADDLGFLPNRAGKILAARKQPIKIGCFLPGSGNAFFEDVVAGMRRAEGELSDFGVSLVIRMEEGYDPDRHISAINYLVKQGCDALCVSTVDIPAMRGLINRTVSDGIPVVAVNTDLTGTKRLCYVGCDYLKGGSTAAGLLTLMARENLNLLIVTGSLTIKGHNERIRGFSQILRGKSISYKLVDILESLDNDEHAYEMTIKVLREHPEINCVYIAAAGVEGACRAIIELQKQNDIYVITHDDIAATRRLLRDGVIDFTIGQEPETQGYKSIHLIFDYFIGGKRAAPENHITDTVIRISENLPLEATDTCRS